MQAGQPGEAMVIRPVGYAGRLAIMGVVLGALLATLCLLGPIAELVKGNTVALVVLPIGVLGVWLGLSSLRSARREQNSALVIEAGGIRLEHAGHGFAVGWPELSGVGIAWTVTGSGASQRVSSVVSCHLDLFPADPGFAVRHPSMQRFWQRRGLDNGYRVLVGDRARIPQLEAGITRYRPDIFLGVTQG